MQCRRQPWISLDLGLIPPRHGIPFNKADTPYSKKIDRPLLLMHQSVNAEYTKNAK
ncbi:hypothetical protein SynA1562_00054 [Synechococcus sp. A15-62]|nr:hypothetical protein SynA1562_00054 [Synechococcus sp. A15-62]